MAELIDIRMTKTARGTSGSGSRGGSSGGTVVVQGSADYAKTSGTADFAKRAADAQHATAADTAAMADEARHAAAADAFSEAAMAALDEAYLSKRRSDRTAYGLAVGGKLTAEGGAQFGESFAPGVTGHGGLIDGEGNGELESLTLRRFLEVPELRYNRVTVEIGNRWNAPGGGVIETVTPIDAESGIVTLHLEEGEIGAVAVDDICMGIFHDEANPSSNATEDTDDSRGNFTFAGFGTVYFRITEVMSDNGRASSSFRYKLRPGRTLRPSAGMSFVGYGNFTNKERQTSRYSTRTYERYLRGVDNWEFGERNIAAQFGDLTNLSVHGLRMEGYSAYLNNIYMTGTIEQTEDDTYGVYAYLSKVPGKGTERLDRSVTVQIPGGDTELLGVRGNMVLLWLAPALNGESLEGEWDRLDSLPDVIEWDVTRESGDSDGDAAWNAAHPLLRLLHEAPDSPMYYEDRPDGDPYSYGVGWVEIRDADVAESGATLFRIRATVGGDYSERVVTATRAGGDGKPGEPGRGVESVRELYVLSVYELTVPDRYSDVWGESVQTPTREFPYLWNMEEIHYTDGTKERTTPHIAARWTKDGDPGRGIVSIKDWYAVNNDPRNYPPLTDTEAWSDTPMTTSETSRYLWNYEEITYTSGEPERTEPRIIGTHGKTGDKGDDAVVYRLVATPETVVFDRGKQTFDTATIEFSAYRSEGGKVSAIDLEDDDYKIYRDGSLVDKSYGVNKGDTFPATFSLRVRGVEVDRVTVSRVDNGETGTEGAIVRTTEWATGKSYHNGKDGEDGFLYLDVVSYEKKYYTCKVSHRSDESCRPDSDTYHWQEMNQMKPIHTPLVVAENVMADYLTTHGIQLTDESNNVCGHIGSGAFPFWIGGSAAELATVRHWPDGRSQYGSQSGQRVEINPADNGSVRVYDSDGKEVARFSGESLNVSEAVYPGGVVPQSVVSTLAGGWLYPSTVSPQTFGNINTDYLTKDATLSVALSGLRLTLTTPGYTPTGGGSPNPVMLPSAKATVSLVAKRSNGVTTRKTIFNDSVTHPGVSSGSVAESFDVDGSALIQLSGGYSYTVYMEIEFSFSGGDGNGSIYHSQAMLSTRTEIDNYSAHFGATGLFVSRNSNNYFHSLFKDRRHYFDAMCNGYRAFPKLMWRGLITKGTYGFSKNREAAPYGSVTIDKSNTSRCCFGFGPLAGEFSTELGASGNSLNIDPTRVIVDVTPCYMDGATPMPDVAYAAGTVSVGCYDSSGRWHPCWVTITVI